MINELIASAAFQERHPEFKRLFYSSTPAQAHRASRLKSIRGLHYHDKMRLINREWRSMNDEDKLPWIQEAIQCKALCKEILKQYVKEQPLPEGWKRTKDADGKRVYLHSESGVMTRRRPWLSA